MQSRSLRSSRDFRRVYKEGRRARSDGVTVVAAANTLGGPRLGISLRRDVGNAVKRNKAKRRLREVFRHSGIQTGFDVVIQADQSASQLEFRDLQGHVLKALRETEVLT